MVLNLELSKKEEEKLLFLSERNGTTVEKFALKLLEANIDDIFSNKALIEKRIKDIENNNAVKG